MERYQSYDMGVMLTRARNRQADGAASPATKAGTPQS